MGRRKISIKQIADPKLRHITFNKRKNGLIKKAAELAMLCNVNMLLIFEDANGSLIQFSRDKVSSLGQFFRECRYNSVLELTANDYPNFFKVNHYKKAKEKDKEDMIAEMNEIRQPKNGRTYSQFSETDHTYGEEVNTSDKLSTKDQNPVEYQPTQLMAIQKDVQKGLVVLPSGIIMTENTTSPKSEDANQKKNKNKFGLRLNIQKEEEKTQANNQALQNIKQSPIAYKPTIEDQIRAPIERTPVEIIQSPFFTDPFQQLGGMLENSPFKFYNANSKNRFLTRLTSGAEDLSSVLKGTPSYIFPVGGITPMLKSGMGSEIDDKLLDTAKIASLLSETNRIFTFQNANLDNNGNKDGGDSALNTAKELQHHLYQYQRQGSRGYFEEIETNDGKINDLEVKKKVKEH